MNRRTAKRLALTVAWSLIDDYIRSDLDAVAWKVQCETGHENPSDIEKVKAELDEIAQRLYERASRLAD